MPFEWYSGIEVTFGLVSRSLIAGLTALTPEEVHHELHARAAIPTRHLPMTPSIAPESPPDGSPPGRPPYPPTSGVTVGFDAGLLTVEHRRLAKLGDTGVVSDEEFDTFEPEHVESALPQLERTDDPRGGGAVAWALLAVGVAVVVGVLLAAMWAAGAW
jgi:hypothetical protein